MIQARFALASIYDRASASTRPRAPLCSGRPRDDERAAARAARGRGDLAVRPSRAPKEGRPARSRIGREPHGRGRHVDADRGRRREGDGGLQAVPRPRVRRRAAARGSDAPARRFGAREHGDRRAPRARAGSRRRRRRHDRDVREALEVVSRLQEERPRALSARARVRSLGPARRIARDARSSTQGISADVARRRGAVSPRRDAVRREALSRRRARLRRGAQARLDVAVLPAVASTSTAGRCSSSSSTRRASARSSRCST